MQVGVAIGAVNGGGEFSVQRNGAADGIERKIRRVRFALDFDLIQVAVIFTRGGKCAADAGEGVEVGVRETVVAGNRRKSGIFGVPRTESAARGDFTFGPGVGERAVKIEGPGFADISQNEVVNVEIERILAGFFRKNDQVGIVADNFAEEHAGNWRVFAGVRRGVVFAGRNGDDHVFDVDAFDVPRHVNDAEDAEIERKPGDLDERRHVGTIAVAQGQAFTGHLHARSELDVEGLQLDIAVEALAEFANDPLARAVVNVAGTEKREQGDAGEEAEEDSHEIGPKAKGANG